MEKVCSNTYETSNNSINEVCEIENKISEELLIDDLAKILPLKSYLIGGYIRDIILEKTIKNSDLDIYTRMNQTELVASLKEMGFSESQELEIKEGEYFFDDGKEYLYFYFKGKMVEIKFIGETKIEDLLSLSDINFNCCAYDINNKKIVNNHEVTSIKKKILKFSNPDIAINDPLKIFSALKQIARLPDIKIPEETDTIIKGGIGCMCEYFINNPEKKLKLKSLLCEINTAQAVEYFSEKQKTIFQGMETKINKLKIPEGYFSKNINELSSGEYEKILSFVKEKYGKRVDSSKLESKKVNSVIFNKLDDGEMKSCCLFNGLRLYAIASSDVKDIVKMVKDIATCNSSVWTTISINHKLLIKLSIMASLKIENDTETIYKILSGQSSNYLNNISYGKIDNMVTFKKKNSNNPEQVLLRK